MKQTDGHKLARMLLDLHNPIVYYTDMAIKFKVLKSDDEPKIEKKRKRRTKKGGRRSKRWTPSEDQILRSARLSGRKYSLIAKEMKRSVGSCHIRFNKVKHLR